MKMKRLTAMTMAAVMALTMCACGKTEPATENPGQAQEQEEEPVVGMGNPWVTCSEEEAGQHAPNGFSAPEGATNVSWSLMYPGADYDNDSEVLTQVTFDYNGISYTAREQVSYDSPADISGMYYDWQLEENVQLANWAGGAMQATVRSYSGQEESAQLCTWYDIETGYSYSLGATSDDLSRINIVSVAEAIYDPAKQASASIPDEPDESGEAGSGETAGTLPAYEYPGPEAFYYVLYQYIIDEFGSQYDKADVSIPCPVITDMDESNRDDILVWGDFEIYNYDLNGDILECVSGGSYPGLMHLRFTDDAAGYEVTEVELAGDGSDFEPTAKKIFGDHYEEFSKVFSDQEEKERIRAQIISNYVAANNLSITAYQDYGWDPVTLPEENIDSFYSILD